MALSRCTLTRRSRLLFTTLIFAFCIHVAIVVFAVETTLIFFTFGVIIGVVSVVVILAVVPIGFGIIAVVFVDVVFVFLVVILPVGVVVPTGCLLL